MNGTGATPWRTGRDVDWRDLADLIWLIHVTGDQSAPPVRPEQQQAAEGNASLVPDVEIVPPGVDVGPEAIEHTSVATPAGGKTAARPVPAMGREGALTFDARVPAGSALPGRLEIGRALRALKRHRPSRRSYTLDIEATIDQFCESRVLVPIPKPAQELWFRDVAIVADGGPTMVVWNETIDAFAQLLQFQGAFDRVSRWTLTGDLEDVHLVSVTGLSHGPQALVDYDGRRLILVVSDCVGQVWQGSHAWSALSGWGRLGPVAIVQMLPPRLWPATALGDADVTVNSHRPGEPNRQLRVRPPWWWGSPKPPEAVTPVVTLDEDWLRGWAQMLMGASDIAALGVTTEPPAEPLPDLAVGQEDPEEMVESFRSTVSDEAFRLATLLAAVDVSLPIARLILDELIPDGRQTHLAEVIASGLLKLPSQNTDDHRYAFQPGVRGVLQNSLTSSATIDVWRTVAPYLEATSAVGSPFALILDSGPEALGDEASSAMNQIAADLVRRMVPSRARDTVDGGVVRAADDRSESVGTAGSVGDDGSVDDSSVADDVFGDNRPLGDIGIGEPTGPFSGHTGAVLTVACTVLDGRSVAVSAGMDRTVRLWDVQTGEAIGGVMVGHSDQVNSLACIELDGRVVAVSASSDRTLRVWNLSTQEPIGEALIGHHSTVHAVACIGIDGRSVAVSAGGDNSVRIWDLSIGREVGALTGQTNSVRTVSCTTLRGLPVAVTGGDDGILRTWDLRTGELIGDPRNGHLGSVRAVACIDVEGKVVAVSVGDDGARSWDLLTGLPRGDMLTASDAATSVACTELAGRAVAVLAGDEPTLLICDLATGAVLGEPLTGRPSRTNSVACIDQRGRSFAISAGEDWTLGANELTGIEPDAAEPVVLSPSAPQVSSEQQLSGNVSTIGAASLADPSSRTDALPTADVRSETVPMTRIAYVSIEIESSRGRDSVFIVDQFFQVRIGLSERPSTTVTAPFGAMVLPPDEARLTVSVTHDPDSLETYPDEKFSLISTPNNPYPAARFEFVARVGTALGPERRIGAYFELDGQLVGVGWRSLIAVDDARDIEGAPSLHPDEELADLGALSESSPDLILTIRRSSSAAARPRLKFAAYPLDAAIVVPDAPSITDVDDDVFAESDSKVFNSTRGGLALFFVTRGIGVRIGSAMPIHIQDIIHSVIDSMQGRPPSILILTDDARIPWELAVFERSLDSDGSGSPFLHGHAAVGRWPLTTRRRRQTPPAGVDVDQIATVVADYSGVIAIRPMPGAVIEATALQNRYHPTTLVDATLPGVMALLDGSPPADIIHFALRGHSEGLMLIDKTTTPRELNLNSLMLESARLRGRPFIFINSGQSTFGGYTEMAATFIAIGASGVIAPLWNLYDEESRQGALAFYELVLEEHLTVGEALQRMRSGYTRESVSGIGGDVPSGLGSIGLQFFGNPNLRLEWSPTESESTPPINSKSPM